MQLGLFSRAAWTNLFYALIELNPSFYIPICPGMSPALPVSTSRACTADPWQSAEEQQHNRCHSGWPQKLGTEPHKAGSPTKLNSRFYKGSVVLWPEMDGHTWAQLWAGELWAGRAFFYPDWCIPIESLPMLSIIPREGRLNLGTALMDFKPQVYQNNFDL